MKKLMTICAAVAFAFSVQAQSSPEEQQDQQEAIQDKIQQEPPRETQLRVENATVRDANNPNQQNDKAKREQEELVKKEKERSTGQEDKNPAQSNPQTVKPATTSEPVSKPLKRRN